MCFSNRLLTLILSEILLITYIYSPRCLYSNKVNFPVIKKKKCPKANLETKGKEKGEEKTTYSPNTQRPQMFYFAVFFASLFCEYFLYT